MGLSTFHSSPSSDEREKNLFDGQAMSVADYLRLHRAGLTSEQLRYVSMAHGVKGEGEVALYSPLQPEVRVYVGASLVTAKPERPEGGVSSTPPTRVAGDMVRFSNASRRRLMRTIAKTRRDSKPIFATLTYPDIFPYEHKKWKRDIDVFGKRLRRKFPTGSFVWRIEFKERKSGESKGKIAPHYHLLVWNVALLDFRGWADSAWYNVVGSKDADHRLAGVSSEAIRKWGGTMAYVSKYIAKVDSFPDGWNGRVWGIVGRNDVPWGVELVVNIANDIAVRLVRLGRKKLGLKGKTLVFGLTWLCNVERILDYLEFAEDFL